jgi:transcription elongation factor Elf1
VQADVGAAPGHHRGGELHLGEVKRVLLLTADFMNCPKCNATNVEEFAEEVDIGVGVQRHLVGVTCPVCGQLSVCSGCGVWDFQVHATWCLENNVLGK